MTTALEQANEGLRRAVATRMAGTAADDPKMIGYKLDQGDPEPAPESCCEGQRLRGDSLLRECHGLPKGAEEWRSLHREILDLHVLKTRQYGHEDSAFANVEASALCGVEPWRRALCDLSDCVVRMQRFANGQPVDYENALKDAAMWAMIALVFLRRERTP